MVAHLYLLAVSFHNNATFNKIEIEEKIKRLSEDVNLIYNYKETNKLYVNYNEIYPQIFYSNYTVEEFICNPHELKQNGIDRDVINALQNILIIKWFNSPTLGSETNNKVHLIPRGLPRGHSLNKKPIETTITSKEAKDELLSWIDEKNCHGLIAFHKIDGLDDNLQIIYGIDGWYKFRRYFLSLYPSNGDFFINECAKYFPNLFFHKRNKIEVSHFLRDSPKKLVHYLSELNDKFALAKTVPYDRKKSLKQFNSMCSFDCDASDEGNSGLKKKSIRKKEDTFIFLDKDNKEVEVCCDLHLKILKDDKGTISTDRRIYFNEGCKDIGLGKILIGHIGGHT